MALQIDQGILPFAAQTIGTILRVCGWGLEGNHLPANQSMPHNSDVARKITDLTAKLGTAPKTENLTYVEEGRLRIEATKNPGTVRAYLFMGDLKLKEPKTTT